ncbi:MAG: signal peptidase I [Coriobacteriales bacterium]|jgi:signal peptidase I|nr:signal peptidase I [Coriobacteriales bacterium]
MPDTTWQHAREPKETDPTALEFECALDTLHAEPDLGPALEPTDSLPAAPTAAPVYAPTFELPPAAPTPVPASHKAPPSRSKRIIREIIEILAVIVVAIIITTLLRTFVIDQYIIPTGSMIPTIEEEDHLFAEKVSYVFGSIHQGDIVTFNDPILPGRILIKRVIAVEGQTVDLVDGAVYIDGKPLDEPYTHGKESTPLELMGGVTLSYPFTVPDGAIWVMGDNRTNSLDSRYFGPISEDEVTGRAIIRIWPLDRFGGLD